MHDDFWREITTKITPVDRPGRWSVHDQIGVAFAAGWSPAGLAAWVGRQVEAARGRITNRAGFVVAQLRAIPAVAEPDPATVAKPPPACDQCLRHSPYAATNLRLRYRHDAAGDVVMCECHPGYTVTRQLA